MPPHPDDDLADLLSSFASHLPEDLLDTLRSYLHYGEPALALEELSTAVYEHHLAVDPEREARFLALSEAFHVDPSWHAFVGRTPPYPDLRTPEQLETAAALEREPSLDTVVELARRGRKIPAVWTYRQLTGAGLAEAVAAVEALERGESPSVGARGDDAGAPRRASRLLILAALAGLLLLLGWSMAGSP